MKMPISKSTLIKIVKVLKWGKIAAKLAAIGTTISGAVTALSGSATSGVALSAAGATTYAAAKGIPTQGYEKTKHIPPTRSNSCSDKPAAAAIMMQQDAEKPMRKAAGKPGKMMPGGASAMQAKKPAMRSAMSSMQTMRLNRKK